VDIVVDNVDKTLECAVEENILDLKSTIRNEASRYKSIIAGTLNCLYFNARSIVNKIQDLELLLRDENPDIVGITETWLNASILDSEMMIEGYTLLRKDRRDNRRGGGVAFYIKNEINFVCREDLFEENFPEALFCNIICGNEVTLIGICYRPPNSLIENDMALYTLLHRVTENKAVIVGDFNFPELDWSRLETISDDHAFVKCVNDNFLIQLVDNPTRENNILDLVLTSDSSIISNVTVGEPFESSDHQIIRWQLIGITNMIKNNVANFNYFKADYHEIRTWIQEQNWNTKLIGKGLENSWNLIKSDLILARNKFVPKFKKRKSKCKWVTRQAVKCRKAKVKAWNNYIKSGRNRELYETYKLKLRVSVKENNKAKQCFEEKLADNIKNDSKSFYAYVKSKQRTKARVGPLKDSTGKIVTEDQVAADIMNSYFASVFTVEDRNNIPEPEGNLNCELESLKLKEIKVTEAEVISKLDNLKVDKSAGPDDIHAKLLFELRSELTGPLTHIFNVSLQSGEVPQDWRDASVAPLFKKGSKNNPENYRPISLTSIVGKILESIIKDHIVHYLDSLKLINSSQHGFTKGKSCLTNLLEFFEKITLEIDNDNPVDCVYLDFSKAFDKVPYVRLFRKLQAHGIDGSVLLWIKHWLGGRRQQVCINREMSGWKNVTSGVPQGSVLGPVLFLVYINDLDLNLISKIGKFADDTKMCKSVKLAKDAEILQNDLDKLDEWSKKWQMEFNKDKCMVMHVGKSNCKTVYKLGDTILKSSTQERDLGIIVDNSIKFTEQCNAAISNANSTLGLIRRTIKNKNKNIIGRLYKGLVRPKLEYCVQAWCPFLKGNVKNLERVQRRATKLVDECRGMTYADRLAVMGLSSLEDRRTRGDMIEVFKMIKGFSGVDYRLFFALDENGRTRGHRYKLIKNRSRLNIRKNFFSQRVVDVWNKLPASVVEAESVNCFKNRYDTHRDKDRCHKN
jgi:ribonucleases P/MRP protein subunit RPP40